MKYYQAYYNGKRVGNPRTEKEKIRVEPLYIGITWVEVPEEIKRISTEGVKP